MPEELRTRDGVVSLPPLIQGPELDIEEQTARALSAPAERQVSRHQELLDLLSEEPMVRRTEPPLRVEATPNQIAQTQTTARVLPPVPVSNRWDRRWRCRRH
jgi:hypothetical protein